MKSPVHCCDVFLKQNYRERWAQGVFFPAILGIEKNVKLVPELMNPNLILGPCIKRKYYHRM